MTSNLETTIANAKALKKLAGVAAVKPWNDRYYVNLEGFSPACAGDRHLKIWVKGDVVTVEGDKGSWSPALTKSLDAFLDALTALGAVRKGYSDTVEATYTLV